MRTIRRMVWLLVLACLLVGCGQQTAEEEALAGAYVYYINNSGTALLSAPSGVEGNDENALKKLFVTLRDGEFPEGHSALPKTVDLDHTAWQEKCLVLYLTGEYPQAGTPEETLCRAALAQTLLPVAEADSMVINVNDQPLTDINGAEVGAIKPDSFILTIDNNGGERRETEYTLYFANATATALVPETRRLEVGVDESDASIVLELLIRGPGGEGHAAVLPPNVSILGVSVRDRICYVNVNDAFLSEDTGIPGLLQVYAIVNSLTELPDIDQVQLTVGGNADVMVGTDLNLGTPLLPREDLTEKKE